MNSLEEWLRPKTDEELQEIEKNWVKTAVECGDTVWLENFGYHPDGTKK